MHQREGVHNNDDGMYDNDDEGVGESAGGMQDNDGVQDSGDVQDSRYGGDTTDEYKYQQQELAMLSPSVQAAIQEAALREEAMQEAVMREAATHELAMQEADALREHEYAYGAHSDGEEVMLPASVPILELDQLERAWEETFPVDRRSCYQDQCFLRDDSSSVPQVL
jgi:hypothetical protein